MQRVGSFQTALTYAQPRARAGLKAYPKLDTGPSKRAIDGGGRPEPPIDTVANAISKYNHYDIH